MPIEIKIEGVKGQGLLIKRESRIKGASLRGAKDTAEY
jgi:hypothetical protein